MITWKEFMKKFRNLVNTDFYRGNTLYNNNGKPRTLTYHRGTRNYTFEDSIVAWYTKEELMDIKNGWKVECFEDKLVELLREAIDLRLIDSFTYEKQGIYYGNERGTKVYRTQSHNNLVVDLTKYDCDKLGIIGQCGWGKDDQYVLSSTDIDEAEFGNYCKVLSLAICEELERIKDLENEYNIKR